MQAEGQKLHYLKNIYLPTFPERHVELANSTFGRHEERRFHVADGKVLFQQAVINTILREFHSRKPPLHTQYGFHIFPAKSAIET